MNGGRALCRVEAFGEDWSSRAIALCAMVIDSRVVMVVEDDNPPFLSQKD